MQPLKVLVIVLGVVIVIGLGIVVVTVVQRLGHGAGARSCCPKGATWSG